MPLNPATRLGKESLTKDRFSPAESADAVYIQPTHAPSPELDRVHVSEGESPKLETPEGSNPLKVLPLDVSTLSRALDNLALAKERGCISVVQSDSAHHEERMLTTSAGTQLHCHPVPPLVISPHLFGPDPSGPPSAIVESHSSKKKKGGKGKKRKRKAPTLHGVHGINATNKSMCKPHSSPLDILSEYIQNAISTSIFECIDSAVALTNAAEQVESPEPKVSQEVATDNNEGRNKMEVTDSEWIKLAQPATQDEITGAMSIEEILAHLADHGCEDVTHRLKIKSSSEYPVSNGGFGDVYRVILHDGRQLAFKCVRLRVGADIDGKKYLERAAHELYVWSKCQHRNVMELVGVAQFRNQLAMVSPWVDSGDLKWFIGCNPEVDRCALCVQVADGVTYLHGRGIVHGDLKAANILVSRDRTVKITDFGNAALAEYSLQFTSNAGGFSVSPRWTAPEILEEKTKTTVVGDIFALGMTILEVITGAYPYDGVKDVVVSAKIMNRVHPPRPEAHIPTGSKHADRLWSLLTSCWASDGQDRPTALKVRNEMKKITPKGLKSVPRRLRR